MCCSSANPSRNYVSLLLFIGAALAGCMYAIYGPVVVPMRRGGEMVGLGINLAHTGSYSDPFAETLPTGPTAVVPPLYPFLIGALIRCFGNSGAWILMAVLAMAAVGAQAALLPRASEALFGDATPGLIAAVFCVALPLLPWLPYWDAPFSAVAGMAYCIFTAGIMRKRFPSQAAVAGAICGAGAGVLLLLSPSLALVCAAWMVYRLIQARAPLGRSLALCAAASVAALLVASPWLVRNYRLFGTATIKDNLGMTLFSSNNDCAEASMARDFETGCYGAHHPARSIPEARLLVSMGEARYDSYRTASALHWIRDHPARFARLTALRIVQFWFPHPSYGLYAWSIWLATAVSFGGIALLVADRSPAASFLLLVFTGYPLVYYVVVSDPRYRYPILWLSLLAAGYAVARLIRRRA